MELGRDKTRRLEHFFSRWVCSTKGSEIFQSEQYLRTVLPSLVEIAILCIKLRDGRL